MLEYSFLFSLRSKLVDENVKTKRIQEMTKAFSKIYKLGDHGNKDISY